MEEVLKNLKCFTRDKKKIHFVCCCEDNIIKSISQLLKHFLNKKLKIKKRTKLRRKLYPIRRHIRKLADVKVSLRGRRQILVDNKVSTILFPILKNTFVPELQKLVEKKNKK